MMSADLEPLSGVCSAIGSTLFSFLDALGALARRIAAWATSWFTQEAPPQALPVPPAPIRLTYAHRQPWHARVHNRVDTTARMRRNSTKAASEHPRPFFATAADATASLDSQPTLGLRFERSASAPQENDAHFYLENEGTIITGVLQGYDGGDISHFASERFQKRFAKLLHDYRGDAHPAFEHFVEETQRELIRMAQWYAQGSTGVFCFIDKQTSTIYAMTIGACEATIYRQFGRETKAIPLSPVRSWDSPKDRQRLLDAGFAHPPTPYSRALGGGNFQRVGNRLVVIPKPKITMQRLRPGDDLVLCTQPLKRRPEAEIIATVNQREDAPLAERLAQGVATVVAFTLH